MRYPGGLIRATPRIPSSHSAPGIWTLAEALQAKAQGLWPPYRTVGADFDGTDDYLLRGGELTGLSDGKQGTVSIWFRLDGGDGARMALMSNAGGFFIVQRFTDNKVQVRAFNSSTTLILAMQSTGTIAAGASWHHLLASWDMAVAGARHLYVNGTSVLDAGALTFTNDTIDYTRGNWSVGAENTPAFIYNGCLADIWFNTTYLDLSDPNNLAKFRNAGKPVYLGDTGELVTGSASKIYLQGPTAQFATNKGSGGGFTVNGGGLGTPSSSPTD
jgi:hypothetical protein